ncbi:hypothetical protein [Tenacibaculum sp. C7A-26P2]|uniref:hypothetical protein n=1 Tax=Tenacibaculum sp. C7A-26P2 TaxID=3447504 RepID=UPI003F85E82E
MNKTTVIILMIVSIYRCQDDTQILFSPEERETFKINKRLDKTENKLKQREKIIFSKVKGTKKGFQLPEVEQMPTPYLHPNGNSEADLFYKNRFFYILDIKESLRNLLEHYNKFTIHTNLNVLSHPAQIHISEELPKLLAYRRLMIKEIKFVKNEILKYNSLIEIDFPNISYQCKMAGYYSFDNKHIKFNRNEFSIEDVDNFSYSYHRKLVTKNLLKAKNAKLKLQKPQVGSRRGTVFISPGKPNIIRGVFGNDFGSYSLGVAIGMTIEYAITGEIYYYKNAL